jgi:heptosyltransferase II
MKILIIGPAWVGDMVMAQSLFRLIKQQNPASEIDVIASDWTRALLDRMPEINAVISSPFKHGELSIFKRWQFGKSLRANNYHQAIVLPNTWKSAIVPFAAKIPLRTGWLGESRYVLLNDVRVLDEKKLPIMVQRFAALGLPKNTKLPDQIPNPKLMVKSYTTLSTHKPVLAICPGGEFGPSKRWPTNYFAEVAKHYLTKNWDVMIFGSEKDQYLAEEINHLTDKCCKNLCGKTSLAEAIDLLSCASLVITNDSGLMHIAAALDKPLVAIYGSTDPKFTPPLSNNAKIVSIELDCRPCFKRDCPLKHHRCMRDLAPQLVIQAGEACML